MKSLIFWLLENGKGFRATNFRRAMLLWLMLAVAAGILPFTILKEMTMRATTSTCERPVETVRVQPRVEMDDGSIDHRVCFNGNKTVFLGPVVLDAVYRSKVNHDVNDDGLCSTNVVSAGGAAVSAARAFQAATGVPTTLAVITGADEPGNVACRILEQEFSLLRRVPTATRTQISILTPKPNFADLTTWKQRTEIDLEGMVGHVLPLFSKLHRLVLASMTARYAALVRRVIESQFGEIAMLLTNSQCEDRETTLQFIRNCSLVVADKRDLAILTENHGDVIAGINWLRDRNVKSVIVTAGRQGTYAYLEGRWAHVPALDVNVVHSRSRCSAILLGTYLAGVDRDESPQTSLKMAAAAAAMHAAGVVQSADWGDIEAFTRSTPTRPFELESPHHANLVQVLTSAAARVARPAGYVTAGAALVVSLMALLS
jgi:sugar/nucleoside kinase (ribokinase family)